MRKSTKGFTDTQVEVAGQFLKDQFNGVPFTANDVLKAATPKSSPIHDMFEWDDTVAARRWRTMQARWLISSITVVIDEVETRAYVSPVTMSIDGEVTRGYLSVKTAMRSSEVWGQVLERAVRELEFFQLKYQHLKELRGIFKEAEKLKERLSEKAEVKARGRKPKVREKVRGATA